MWGSGVTKTWAILVILISVILIDEILLFAIGGDLYGGFLWITFHFIINPLLALIYVVVVIIRVVRNGSKREPLWKIIYSIPAIFFIYLSVSGNMYWAMMIKSLANMLS